MLNALPSIGAPIPDVDEAFDYKSRMRADLPPPSRPGGVTARNGEAGHGATV